MRLQTRIINASLIRDVAAVNSDAIIIPGHSQLSIVVANTLNQAVTMQVQAWADIASAYVNVGDAFVVAASDTVIKILTRETSGLHYWYRVTAICAVAPASGSVTVDTIADIDWDMTETWLRQMGNADFLIPPIQSKVYQYGNRAAVSAGAYACIYYNISGGWFRLAQAGNWSSVPSIGITKDSVTSGVTATFHSLGPIQNITSGVWNFSGRVGEPVFLGTSSQVVVSSPAASGNIIQRLGVVKSVDMIDFRPEQWYTIYSP